MKKRCLLLMLACLIAVMSCEIPQSVTIKGTPGLSLSLGSPFKEGQRLEDKISSDGIRDMMEDPDDPDSGKVNTYDYRGGGVDENVQAYVVHYPIAEMKLDLEEYIRDAFKTDDGEPLLYPIGDDIPNMDKSTFDSLYPDGCYLTGDSGPQPYAGTPSFTVNLSDMTKLLSKVENGPFGIEIPYSVSFENNLRVSIPALDIDNYIQGEKAGDNLRFVTIGVFNPKDTMIGGKFEIYIKLMGPCSGTIAPDIVFEWEKATIHTENESLKGKYPLKNSLRNFLGSDVEFSKVEGYIYVEGVGDDATLSLRVVEPVNDNEIEDLLEGKDNQITDKSRPDFIEGQPFDGDLTIQSLTEPIDLTEILSSGRNSTLECVIIIPEMEINKNDDASRVITADMVILIPLEFKVKTPSSEPGYVKLDLGDALPQSGNGGDLFGRTGNNDDDLFSQISTVEIILNKEGFTNDIIDNRNNTLFILVPARSENKFLDFATLEPVTFYKDDLAYPFSPQFEIIIKKDDYQDYGTLKIRRQELDNPKFDFTLTIKAIADIDHTISLSDL